MHLELNIEVQALRRTSFGQTMGAIYNYRAREKGAILQRR